MFVTLYFHRLEKNVVPLFKHNDYFYFFKHKFQTPFPVFFKCNE